MLLRAGLLCEQEGVWLIQEAQRVPQGRNLVLVGGHIYTERGDPLTRGAPAILEAVDAHSGFKHHRKDAKRLVNRWHAQKVELFDTRAKAEALAGPDGWKHAKTLRDFPSEDFLRFTCRRCGRVRIDQVGRLRGEGRLGDRTVAELEAVETCYGCHGELTAELE